MGTAETTDPTGTVRKITSRYNGKMPGEGRLYTKAPVGISFFQTANSLTSKKQSGLAHVSSYPFSICSFH